MSKLTTDVLLKESIKSILTELVNSTYDWQEYTDEEIGQIVELDPTQVAELSAVINDSVAATNKVYSSQHTKELIQESLIEGNKYADDLVANLSNIKLDIVDSLPDSSTVNKSTIYILKDSSGGTNNTLNVWSDTTSAFVEVGKLSVNMDNYYTKSEVDTELTKKANADEVLKPDAIVADLTTTSGSTTLSTAGLQTELDKKANDDEVVKKTDIATSISNTPSDNKVASEKAVFDKINDSVLGIEITASNYSQFDSSVLNWDCGVYVIGMTSTAQLINDLPQLVAGRLYITSISKTYESESLKYRQYRYITFGGNEFIRSIEYQSGSASYDTGWRRVCTTKVTDVAPTGVPLDSSKFQSGSLVYEVKNGVCYVYIMVLNAKTTFIGTDMSSSPMPKPSSGLVTVPIVNDVNGANIGLFYIDASLNSTPRCHIFTQSVSGYATLSYSVAES